MHHEQRRLVLGIVLALAAAGLSAQGKRKVDVDVLYSAAVGATEAAPDKFWAADGSAWLCDRRTPQGLVRLDPATGKTTPCAQAPAVLAALAKFGPKLERFEWPEGFDRAGKRALYELEGDVFVADLVTGEVWRITETPDVEEKAPRLSPDGTKVAYVVKNDLWVCDLATAKRQQLTRDGSDTILNGTLTWVYWEEIFGRQDVGYWWSPDSTTIAYLQTDESKVPLCSFVDFKPATPMVHVQRYPKAGADNPKVALGFVSATASGDPPKTAWADLSKKPWEYLCRVTWLPDGKRAAVQTLTRAQTTLDLQFVDRATGEAQPILAETDPAWINVNDDLTFLDDGIHFLWVSERTGFAHVYRYKLDGTLVNPVTSGEWAVHDTGAVYWLHQAIKGVDEKSGWVYFNSHKKRSIENHVYRAKIDGSTASAPEELTHEHGIHSPAFSRDATLFLDEWSNAATPKSVVLCKADGMKVADVAPPFLRSLKAFEVPAPEFFTVPAADGFEMPAYLYKPKDFDPSKRYPVILYGYAGPSAPTVLDAWNGMDSFYHAMLLQEGYLVGCIEPRCATAISKKTENVMLNQMYGDSQVADMAAGLKWLKAQTFVDPARIGVWGWSGGGSMTILAMTHLKDFKAGIAVAGVTRWEFYDSKWAEQVMKRPQDNAKGYERCDLTKAAKDLHGRIMLVFGTFDDNVHPQNAQAFIDELIQAGKHYELQIYPMRKHGIDDLAGRKHLFSTMVDFWKRNL